MTKYTWFKSNTPNEILLDFKFVRIYSVGILYVNFFFFFFFLFLFCNWKFFVLNSIWVVFALKIRGLEAEVGMVDSKISLMRNSPIWQIWSKVNCFKILVWREFLLREFSCYYSLLFLSIFPYFISHKIPKFIP